MTIVCEIEVFLCKCLDVGNQTTKFKYFVCVSVYVSVCVCVCVCAFRGDSETAEGEDQRS